MGSHLRLTYLRLFGGLVFEAHRLLRVIKKKKEDPGGRQTRA